MSDPEIRLEIVKALIAAGNQFFRPGQVDDLVEVVRKDEFRDIRRRAEKLEGEVAAWRGAVAALLSSAPVEVSLRDAWESGGAIVREYDEERQVYTFRRVSHE